MKVKSSLILILIMTVGIVGTSLVFGQNISLNITGIKSSKGQLVVSVFKNQQSFKDEAPEQKSPFSKTAVTNGVLKVNLTLEPGTYGVAIIDDENTNQKMDKKMFGIPKEGFGFSNFYLSGMSRPTFSDFKFEVKAGTPVKLESKLRYM